MIEIGALRERGSESEDKEKVNRRSERSK